MTSFYSTPGPAATIEIGEVTRLEPGTTPAVTNTGTPTAAVLNFAIPQGDSGTVSTLDQGSAASPALRFSGDANTGVYSPGPDQLALSTAGTGRLFVDASGRVGIGTSSPSQVLHVAGSSLSTTFAGQLIGDANERLRLGYRTGGPDTGLSCSQVVSDTTNLYLASRDTASGNIIFHTGTSVTEKARIDNSGRLLAGTSSASAFPILPYAPTTSYNSKLQVAGLATGDSGISVSNWATSVNNGGTFGFAKSVSNTVGANGTALIANTRLGSITFSGDDSAKFVLGAAIEALADATWGVDDGPTRLTFSTTPDGSATPVERMRIASNGSILISKTLDDDATPGVVIRPGLTSFVRDNDVVLVVNRLSSDGAVMSFRRSSVSVGTISVTTTATAYNTSSDYRLKENVTPVTDGITRLQQLKPSRFNFIADPTKTVDGFLAHEVQAIVPEAITGEKDAVDENGNPLYQGIDQSKLVPLLTAALQEAIGEIESLKARVAALESA